MHDRQRTRRPRLCERALRARCNSCLQREQNETDEEKKRVDPPTSALDDVSLIWGRATKPASSPFIEILTIMHRQSDYDEEIVAVSHPPYVEHPQAGIHIWSVVFCLDFRRQTTPAATGEAAEWRPRSYPSRRVPPVHTSRSDVSALGATFPKTFIFSSNFDSVIHHALQAFSPDFDTSKLLRYYFDKLDVAQQTCTALDFVFGVHRCPAFLRVNGPDHHIS